MNSVLRGFCFKVIDEDRVVSAQYALKENWELQSPGFSMQISKKLSVKDT